MKRQDYESPVSISEMIETAEVIATSGGLGLPGLPFDDDNTNNYDESF